MEKLGKWNDISDKLYNEIPKLKTGQVVRFQMLNGAENNHPDEKERKREPKRYPKMNLNLKERIFDPYKGKSGEFVDIGVWNNVNEKGQPENFISFMPWAGQYPFTGTFFLIGGRDRDDEYFEILYLSKDRKDNEHNTKTKGELFEIVDPTKQAKAASRQASTFKKALDAAANMSLTEKKGFAAICMWGADLDEDMLSGKIDDYAMKFPVEFIKKAGDPDLKTKTAVGQAFQMGIIKYDARTGKVSNGDTVLTKVDAEGEETWLDAFAEWIKKHTNGSKILATIKSQLKETALED